MANTDRARKLLVRTAFVTSTTIGTLVGAQNLAMMDAKQFLATETPSNTVQNETVSNTSTLISAPISGVTISHEAPTITVIRESAQTSGVTQSSAASSVNTTTTVIQPPVPSQISLPQPVVMQQPVRQRTKSSR